MELFIGGALKEMIQKQQKKQEKNTVPETVIPPKHPIEITHPPYYNARRYAGFPKNAPFPLRRLPADGVAGAPLRGRDGKAAGPGPAAGTLYWDSVLT